MNIYRTDSGGAIVLSMKLDSGDSLILRTADRQPIPLELGNYSPAREWENLVRFLKIWVQNA